EKIRTLEFYNESNKECIETLKKKLKTLKKEKEWVDGKLAGLLTASKDLNNLIESQRPSPTVESTSEDGQNRNPFVSEDVASPITPKPFIKFVKPKDCQSESKIDKKETPKKSPVKYDEQYRKPNKKPNAHSYANRPVHRTSAVRSPYRAPWVPTVNRKYPLVNRKFSTGSRKFPTASRKFPTGSTKGSTANMGRKGKDVKLLACWFWRPSQNLSNKGGCKITGKGTIKTGKLEFENVYFAKDLKYNLFSVSQICDNKNNILFTDSECIVLGKDFKLLDDANILLRTPRQHNMYSIDLNNIVPHRDLTCLVAKASADECML
nr:ribonuclease H-like domain-containing protein [Tanacetum cinerariifolium]